MEITIINSIHEQSLFGSHFSQMRSSQVFNADHLSSLRITEAEEDKKESTSCIKNFFQKTGQILSYPFVKLWQFLTLLFCCCHKENKDLKEFLAAKDPILFIVDHFETFAKAYEAHSEPVMDKIYQLVMNRDDEDKAITSMIILLRYINNRKIKSKLSNVEEDLYSIITKYIFNRIQESKDQKLAEQICAFLKKLNLVFASVLVKLKDRH